MANQQDHIDPALLQRLQRREGIISLAVAHRVVGCLDWLQARRSINAFVLSRRGLGNRRVDSLPIVHARPIAATKSLTPPAEREDRDPSGRDRVLPRVEARRSAVLPPLVVASANIHDARPAGAVPRLHAAGYAPPGVPATERDGDLKSTAEVERPRATAASPAAGGVDAPGTNSLLAVHHFRDPNPRAVPVEQGSASQANAWVVLPAVRRRPGRGGATAVASPTSLGGDRAGERLPQSAPQGMTNGPPVVRGRETLPHFPQQGSTSMPSSVRDGGYLPILGTASMPRPRHAADDSTLAGPALPPQPAHAAESSPAVTPRPAEPLLAAPSAEVPTIDLDALAEKVQRKIVRRLAVEQERRGGLR